jgi:hypothetical protein
LALRYASAAVKPAAKQAASGVKERLAKATSGDGSLKERLNPAKTEQGGRVGDGADALLEKLGTPGKLAAKASLGSRIVERLTPDLDDEADADDRVDADLPETEEEEEALLEEQRAAKEDAADEEAEQEEPDAEEPVAEEPEAEADDEADEPAAEDESEDRIKPVKGHSEPVRAHPGADPLHTDFEHAYSEEVENYEHRDAYASTG